MATPVTAVLQLNNPQSEQSGVVAEAWACFAAVIASGVVVLMLGGCREAGFAEFEVELPL
ncbi:MAG: hypothetical protein JWO79_1219, partial [Actinomycetia bacterium]|nr:hypothetical protein [Actinomycetes bacterium]